MRNPCHWLTATLLSLSCDAAQIARESFDYASASALSPQGGGSGWLGPWFQDGESAVTGAAGLGFTDSLGNVLNASGLSADTSGTATTRSLRDFNGGLLNDVWISSSATIVDGANFDVNRVRIAGQDGSRLLVDELRVGGDFADVTPHSAAADDDGDDDGLTDFQEAVLGLDPNRSDAALISGIQAHPDWFGLHTTSGIFELGNGGVVLQRNSSDPVNLIFEVQQSENLTEWGALETFNRQVGLPAGKNFLRVTLQDR